MSFKKKKKVLKLGSSIFLMILSFLLLLLLILGFRKLFTKPYYSIDSRIKKVSETTIGDSEYKTIGWLRIQGTDIDYPVIYAEDTSTSFPVQLESYVWSENFDTKFHNMIDISGHNIFNLSSSPKLKSEYFHRFEQLMSFVYYDFAKDNKYIQLTIDGKDYLYKIFAVDFIDKSQATELSLKDDYSSEQINNFIDMFLDNSLYDYDVSLRNTDKYIRLHTCTRFFGTDDRYEFYVVGRLVRENEKTTNYKVNKIEKNYKVVEDVLKGADEDEENAL